MRVFVIPLTLASIAALRFAYVRHKHPEAAEDAAGSFRSNLFVVVFIVYRTCCRSISVVACAYPACLAAGVCNEAFSMFNCRSLDGDIDVLRTDYRIICSTTEHSVFRGLAFVVIALFSFGIPLYMV